MNITGVSENASRRFSFDQAALWALMATGVLTVLVFTFSPTISFIGTKTFILTMGALLSLAVYILARLTRGNIIIPPSTLLGAVWFVPLAYALSTLFSGVNPSLAFFGNEFESDTFGFILVLSALASLVALSFRREGDYRFFFKVAGFTFGILVLVQVVFVAIGKFAPNILSPLSNIVGSFSDLGLLLGLGVILLLLALRLLSLPHKIKIALWVVTVLGFFLIALVNSPTIWILITLVSLGLFIEAMMRRRVVGDDRDLEGVSTLEAEADEPQDSSSRSLVTPLIALVISLFFLISGPTIGDALATAAGTSFIDVRPSWQTTFDVGSHTYASSPLFGSGPNTFGEQWLKFRDRALNETIFWNVDFTSGIGYIPTSAVTTGVLGAIAWLAFLGLFLFVGVRSLLFRLPKEPFARFVSVASFIGALYVLALAVLSVPGPVVLAVGFILIGLFISSLRHGAGRIERGVVFSRTPRIGFVVVFLLTILLLATVYAAYVVIGRYLAHLEYGQATAALSAGNLEEADRAINQSLIYAKSDRTYRLAAALGVAHMNEIVLSETLAPSDAQEQFQSALAGSVQSAMAATQIAPNNYQNWLALGGVYQSIVPLNIDGAADEAKTAYARAAVLAPTNPILPYTLAQLEIALANYPGAEVRLLEAVNLKRDYTPAILLLSQLQVQQGKATEALQAVEAAIFFAPDDLATLFQAGVLRLGTGDRTGAIQALARAVEINPDYANARFFLAVSYATSGEYAKALTELRAVAALSAENAAAVSSDIAALEKNQNPYPPARLRTLGVPAAPVAEPSPQGPGTTP